MGMPRPPSIGSSDKTKVLDFRLNISDYGFHPCFEYLGIPGCDFVAEACNFRYQYFVSSVQSVCSENKPNENRDRLLRDIDTHLYNLVFDILPDIQFHK